MIPAMGGREVSASEARGPARILVVDEAVPVRNVLIEILRKLGMAEGEVWQASSAEEALALFKRESPTIVFTELVGVRPEDGLEVVHEMLDRAPTIKIVLVSAEARDSAEVRAAIRAGVFAFIEKPLRHEKIRQVMQELQAEEGGIERLR